MHRNHAILLSADGWQVTQIAELLRVNQSIVHRWWTVLKRPGYPAWPATGVMSGRPPGMKPTNGYWSRACDMIRSGTAWSSHCGRVSCLVAGYLCRATRHTPERRAGQVMFGAVNSRSRQTHFQLRSHKRSRAFQQFFDQQISSAYPKADFIFLIVDGANSYKSKSALAWPKERPQIV